MFTSLLNLFYPHVCVGCNNTLLKAEKFLCSTCIMNLPETNFHLNSDNAVEKIFWGRIPLVQAFSFLFFKKKGTVQHILHELKYKNNPDLGVFIGNMFGSKLKDSGIYFDAIAAVPLHPDKLKLRGYNQSLCFAKGLCESMGSKLLEDTIIRTKATETQTRKGRYERWENVDEVFRVMKPNEVENKSVLLVDDVITTGATIEACASTILDYTNKLSVASIAYAVN